MPYSITDAGKAAFREWIAEMPGPDVIRSRLLLTVFFGRHLERDRFRDILAEQRKEHVALLSSYQAMQESLAGDPYMSATLRYGVEHESHVVEWLTDLERELGQLGPGGA